MATEPEFHVRDEAARELRRLVAHPAQELHRLEVEALEGEQAVSLLLIVLGILAAVSVIALLMYALVVLVAWLVVG